MPLRLLSGCKGYPMTDDHMGYAKRARAKASNTWCALRTRAAERDVRRADKAVALIDILYETLFPSHRQQQPHSEAFRSLWKLMGTRTRRGTEIRKRKIWATRWGKVMLRI